MALKEGRRSAGLDSSARKVAVGVDTGRLHSLEDVDA